VRPPASPLTTFRAPRTTCTVEARFTPTFTGPKAATLFVSGNPGGAVSVGLSGSALGGTVAVAPSNQEFPPIYPGVRTSAKTLTVLNTGSATTGPLTIALGGADAGQFVLLSTTCSNVTLAPNASCTAAVAFLPTSAGSKSAVLTVGGTPARAALSGTGQL
jgi:hypothetical protein